MAVSDILPDKNRERELKVVHGEDDDLLEDKMEKSRNIFILTK